METLLSEPGSADEAGSNYQFLLEKYNRLNEQFLGLLRNNQQIESTLLSMIEKNERDKALLGQEIDELSVRLHAAGITIAQLQTDCARYKSDCVLAVHLLHCQPTNYVPHRSTETLPLTSEDLQRSGIASNGLLAAPERKRLVHVSSFSFPPTAVVFESENIQQHNALHSATNGSRSASDLQEKSMENSLHELFVERILSEPEYKQIVTVAQCAKCGRTVPKCDKQSQTVADKHSWSLESEVYGRVPHTCNSTFTIGDTRIHKSSPKQRTDSTGSYTSTETPI